jgi:hypothetical protein
MTLKLFFPSPHCCRILLERYEKLGFESARVLRSITVEEAVPALAGILETASLEVACIQDEQLKRLMDVAERALARGIDPRAIIRDAVSDAGIMAELLPEP